MPPRSGENPELGVSLASRALIQEPPAPSTQHPSAPPDATVTSEGIRTAAKTLINPTSSLPYVTCNRTNCGQLPRWRLRTERRPKYLKGREPRSTASPECSGYPHKPNNSSGLQVKPWPDPSHQHQNHKAETEHYHHESPSTLAQHTPNISKISKYTCQGPQEQLTQNLDDNPERTWEPLGCCGCLCCFWREFSVTVRRARCSCLLAQSSRSAVATTWAIRQVWEQHVETVTRRELTSHACGAQTVLAPLEVEHSKPEYFFD